MRGTSTGSPVRSSALPVISLDLTPQMAEDEGTRSDDEKSEKADSVRQPATEDGARDEVKKG